MPGGFTSAVGAIITNGADRGSGVPGVDRPATDGHGNGHRNGNGRLADWPVTDVSLTAAPRDQDIMAGGCFARSLPLDPTCAGAARRYFREAVADTDLPADLIHDGVTMASELAANTLNAHGNVEYARGGQRPVSGIPEIWVYLRSHRFGMELVCKVFDSDPAWEEFEPAAEGAMGKARWDSVRGRGLQLVAGLSANHWGHHPTRGRLGAWKVPGKAVWFALRVPPASQLCRLARPAHRGSAAIEALASSLADRGIGDGLIGVAAQRGDIAVLSVSHRLTVWSHGDTLAWTAPDGGHERLSSVDLVEAAERIVCAYETLTEGGHPEPS